MENSHLDLLSKRHRFLLAGTGATRPTSENLRRAVAADDAEVNQILERQIWAASELDHGNLSGKPLQMHSPEIGVSGFYLVSALTLARAFHCPWSRFHKDARVLLRLETGLCYFETFVRPEATRQGTWYGWDIAIPRWLSQILLLSGDDLSPELRARLVRALQATPFLLFAADPVTGVRRSNGAPVGGGANTMEIALHLLMRAAITRDVRWADRALECTPVAMGIAPNGEGIQADWSFHFHGHGVNATYGHICMASQAQWIYLTQDTPWQCGPAESEAHFGALRNFFTQNAWRGRFALHTLDRAPARPGGIFGEVMGSEYLTALLLSLKAAPDDLNRETLGNGIVDWLASRAAEVEAGIRQPLDFGTALLEAEVNALLPGTVSALSATHLYPSSNYLIARRPHWFAAALTSSPSSGSWKSINGEHIGGSSSAEFSVVLMTDGREVSYPGVPTMDWTSLMGVTRCGHLEAAPEGYGQSQFTGALASETLAVMGQQYLLAPPAQGSLRANKSLFVTGDALVMLGTNIRCDASEPVWTTLFHAPVAESAVYRRGETTLDALLDQADDTAIQLQAGETVFLRNVRIQLLEAATLTFTTRCGTYLDMNHTHHHQAGLSPAYEERHRVRWVYLRTHHGIQPQNGSYGAVIWPAVEPDFVPAEIGEIRHEPAHHGLGQGLATNARSGAEVRFPGDWRPEGELSYFGAEPAKWGNLALWGPVEGGKLSLTVQAPLRFLRQPNRATEIILPLGMEAAGCPAVTLDGKPWPKNVWPCMADGQPIHLEVTSIGN